MPTYNDALTVTRDTATDVALDIALHGKSTFKVLTDGTVSGVSSTARTAELALKAPLASPTFTGTFTAPSLVTTATTVGHFGVAPTAQLGAYTQTYSTAARTVPAATVAAVATTAATNTTPYGFSGAAQADAIPVAINALAADVLALKKVITALIDDSQALGFAT